jgi:uncharacterized protein YwqG
MLQHNEDLKSLIRKATKLNITYKGEIPPDTALKSHFGGQPYFEKGEEWPRAKDGTNLSFVCQIFHEKDVELPDNIKIVQFFYDFDDLAPYKTEEDGWLIKIYEKVDPEKLAVIKPIEYDMHKKYEDDSDFEEPGFSCLGYHEIDFEPILTLPDEEEYNYDTDDYKIFDEFNVSNYSCSQVGGYPSWIQYAKREKDNFKFLFQINALDLEGSFLWGDCGSVYISYNNITKETDFLVQSA